LVSCLSCYVHEEAAPNSQPEPPSITTFPTEPPVLMQSHFLDIDRVSL